MGVSVHSAAEGTWGIISVIKNSQMAVRLIAVHLESSQFAITIALGTVS